MVALWCVVVVLVGWLAGLSVAVGRLRAEVCALRAELAGVTSRVRSVAREAGVRPSRPRGRQPFGVFDGSEVIDNGRQW